MSAKVDQLKNKTVNNFLVAITVLVSLAHFLGLFRAIEQGTMTVYLIQLVAVLLLIYTTVRRKQLSIRFKLVILVVIVSLSVVSGLYAYGYFSAAKIYLTLSPVYFSFMSSYRKALVLLAVYLVVFMLFGYLYASGVLTYDFDTTAYASRVNNWAIEMVVILLTSWGIMYMTNSFNNALIDNYEEIEKQRDKLVDNQAQYKVLFEEAFEAIAIFKSGTLIDCNPAFHEMYDYTRGEALGLDADALICIDSDRLEYLEGGQIKAMMANVSNGQSQFFECSSYRKDQTIFEVAISLNAFKLKSDDYIQAVIRDVTERKEAEKELEDHRHNLERLVELRTEELAIVNKGLKSINEELSKKSQVVKKQNKELKTMMSDLQNAQTKLVQAEKMTSLGTLTGGVAHEINNPLNFIYGGYTGLRNLMEEKRWIKDETTLYLLDSIKTGMKRIADIVNALNDFSKTDGSQKEDCDLHSILDNCILMMESQWLHRIKHEKDYCTDEVVVNGNKGELHQVFVNFLQNATQAIDGKEGEIKITTYCDEHSIKVEITDSGCGIKKEDLVKVIDPFYTTKNPGEGTGLGLSLSYQIVKDHDGTLEVESDYGQGTTVLVKFKTKSIADKA